MQAQPAGGAMVAVEATEDEELASPVEHRGRASLAAVNGATAAVLSGDQDAVPAAAGHRSAQGRRTSRLPGPAAAHPAPRGGMLADFGGAARGLANAPPAIPVMSNVTGTVATAGRLGPPGYWVRHVRHVVRFHDGLGALRAAGVGTMLELGPHPVLAALARRD